DSDSESDDGGDGDESTKSKKKLKKLKRKEQRQQKKRAKKRKTMTHTAALHDLMFDVSSLLIKSGIDADTAAKSVDRIARALVEWNGKSPNEISKESRKLRKKLAKGL